MNYFFALHFVDCYRQLQESLVVLIDVLVINRISLGVIGISLIVVIRVASIVVCIRIVAVVIRVIAVIVIGA